MNTTIEALKNLYVARGGELTDSYEDIAGGAQVGNYTVIPDCVSALTKVGGSSDTYETVAEIQVGEMEEQDGHYSYADSIETVPEISESETYYLNDKSNPSTFFNHGPDASIVGFNLKLDDGDPTRIDPSKPFVVVGFTDDVNDSLVVQSDTPDLSNTTVKILKKVEHGGGGGSGLPAVTTDDNGKVLGVVSGVWAAKYDDLIVTMTHTGEGDEISVGKDFSEIVSAVKANRNVRISAIFGENGAYVIPLCAIADSEAVFAMPFMVESGSAPDLIVVIVSEKDGVTGSELFNYSFKKTPETLRVNFTLTDGEDETTTVTADKTPESIADAFNNGAYVYGYVASTGTFWQPTMLDLSSGTPNLEFKYGTAKIENKNSTGGEWVISYN